jgi:uncharacterized integral membrane protein
MRFISWLLGAIVLFIALCFALANRQHTTISLWPLDLEVEAPLYLLSLGTLLMGLFVGAVISWFSVLPYRLEARRLRREIMALRDKIDDLQQSSSEETLLPPPKPKWQVWNRSR